MTKEGMNQTIARTTAEAYVRYKSLKGADNKLLVIAMYSWYTLDQLCENLAIGYNDYYDISITDDGEFEYFMKEVQ